MPREKEQKRLRVFFDEEGQNSELLLAAIRELRTKVPSIEVEECTDTEISRRGAPSPSATYKHRDRVHAYGDKQVIDLIEILTRKGGFPLV